MDKDVIHTHTHTHTHTHMYTHTHTVEYCSAKKPEIMPLATTWMDLQIIILSEVSHRAKYHMVSVGLPWWLRW